MLYQNFPPFIKYSKSINYIHDVLFFDFPQYYSLIEKIYLSPIKFLSKYSDWIITISHNEKMRLVRHKVFSEDKISIVYHGIDPIYYDNSYLTDERVVKFKRKYDLPDEYILYLGRLNERKNIHKLLLAMDMVKLSEQ